MDEVGGSKLSPSSFFAVLTGTAHIFSEENTITLAGDQKTIQLRDETTRRALSTREEPREDVAPQRRRER